MNGTSAPSVAASSTSRGPSGRGDSASRARRTAPASALPPPSPAPAGIRLISSIANPEGHPAASLYAAAARYARFFFCWAQAGGGERGAAHVERSARRFTHRDVVGEIDAQKRGLERVIAGRVPRADVEKEIDLGLRGDARGGGQVESDGGARMSPSENPSCSA